MTSDDGIGKMHFTRMDDGTDADFEYRDNPYFQDAVDFTPRWDEVSFDPATSTS